MKKIKRFFFSVRAYVSGTITTKNVSKWSRQRRGTGSSNIAAQIRNIYISGNIVNFGYKIYQIRLAMIFFLYVSAWPLKTGWLLLPFYLDVWAVFHNQRFRPIIFPEIINISGLGGHIAICRCPSLLQSFVDTFFLLLLLLCRLFDCLFVCCC